MYRDLESKAQSIIQRCNAISERAGRLNSTPRKVFKTTASEKQLGGYLNQAELHSSQVNANLSRLRGMQEDMMRLRAEMISLEILLVTEQAKASESVKKKQK